MRTKADRLTLKQKVFINKTVKLLSPTKAARIAYPENKTPKDIAKKNMKKPHLRQAIEEAMAGVGLTEEFAARRLKEIVENPKTKLDGISVAALNTAGRWRGWEADNRHKLELPSIPKSPEEIDMILIRMRNNTENK